MHIESRFSFDKVKHNQENDVHLVITLKAPKVDWQGKRAPICIVPVVDISGSMGGDKIDYARKSLMKLVEHLKPGDYCGLAVFTTDARLIFKPMEITQSKKEELKAKIGQLRAESSTNFSGGMLLGLDELNKGDLPADVIRRVIMFTDGLANCGVATTREELLLLLEKEIGKATLSAFGYGKDADQDLLADLAKKGKGNYAFIKNPDDALSAFAKELGGLLSVHATDIQLELEVHNGHKFEKVLSDVDVEEKEGKLFIKVPELLGEEERHIVVKMKLSEQAQALPRALNVAEVRVKATVIEEGERRPFGIAEKAKMQFVKPGEEQEKPTPELDKIIAMVEFVAAQIESEKMAEVGNYQGAVLHMQSVGASLNARGHHALHSNALKMGDKMKSAVSYASSAGYRGTSKGLARGMGLSGGDDEAVAEFSAAGYVFGTNASQQELMDSFQQEEPAVFHQPAPVIQPLVVPTPQKKEEPKKGLSKTKSKRW